MGRTTQTIANFLDYLESRLFSSFIKSATPQERLLIAKLFTGARKHITAISMTGHILPFETTLMAMMLEQRRELKEIRDQISLGDD